MDYTPPQASRWGGATRREFLALASLSAVGALSGCAANPVTGENQLMLMSEADEIGVDKQQSPHQFSSDYGTSQDRILNTYLHQIGTRMGSLSHRPKMPYSFRCVNAVYINAYAFPGGSIAVTRGILLKLNNEAELAALLGHEIGHVNARHAASQMSKGIMAQLALAGAAPAAVAMRGPSSLLVLAGEQGRTLRGGGAAPGADRVPAGGEAGGGGRGSVGDKRSPTTFQGETMQYRTLGRTGLRVSEVGFGAWAIGGPAKLGQLEMGWGDVDEAQAVRAIEAAHDAGVTFFDTADVYGAGKSEVLIGKALRAMRDRVVIATKVGNRTTAGGEWVKDFSRVWIMEAIDASLARLGMDHVDLYQLHSPTDTADYRDETFEALERLKAQGKIRFYGISVGPCAHGPWVIQHTQADVIQVVYNMLEREPEQELLPLAKAQNIGIIARVPLASGFLTGKFTPDTRFPANDHRSRNYPPEKIAATLAQIERLRFLTEGTRKTLTQAALQYCLAHPALSTVIPGAKTPEQARANAAASDGVLLTADEVARVQAALA